MSVDSLYNYNPYAMQMQNTGLNNDFMYNATNTQGLQEQLALQQALMQGGNFQQPQVDTFQREGSSSSLGTGLKLATIGGVGAGAGTYFFGDKLGLNMVKDGKFSDEVLKAVENTPEQAEKIATARYANAKTRILGRFNLDDKTLNAIQKYVKAKDVTKLKPEITQLVQQAGIKNQSEALTKLTLINAELRKIDLKGLTAKAQNIAEAGSLQGKVAKLTNLQARENLLHTLANDAKVKDIEKLIKENAKAFGIEGKEAQIENKAKVLAENFKNKKGALKAIKADVKVQQELVKDTRTALNAKAATYWDDTAKAFRADAPDVLKNATKNFKWKTAGKWGAIAAGIGLVLGCVFGGDK